MDSQSLWSELMDLSEQARSEFNALRDLPTYGRKHWERCFQRAFQVYARLWAFQQDHRAALQEEGLQRWEIGEVASRIGQLYHNYYLRTSQLNFLSESYVFYEAIHERQYFAAEGDEDLLVKQLRFYTRFITVCLLLGKREDVWEHLERLQALVDDFAQEAQATDVLEWRGVCAEVEAFLAADAALGDGRTAPPAIRCHAESPLSGVPFTAPFLRLHEAVLACYWHRQAKLGDLPLDSFRMLQALEWEDPSASGSLTPDRHHSAEYWARGGDGGGEAESPAKYLLFRPTASELLAVLATACEGLPPVSALLLYLSAAEDHVRPANHGGAGRAPPGEGSAPSEGGSCGGCGEELSGVCLSPPSASGLDESYLYPEDLLPHTRRPLFLVVDSDNARAFRALAGRERSYPTCCLMSPPAQPPGVRPPAECGRLFTLFLASPTLALCALARLPEPDALSLASWQRTVEAALFDIGEQLAVQAGGEWSDPWVGMFGDVLLRRLVLHFILCRAALALHREHGAAEELQPTCFPPLPEAASTSADVVAGALRSIVEAMGCADQFHTAGPLRQKSFSESEAWQAGLRSGGRQPV